MTTLADQARLMTAYNAWADDRVLAAAQALSPEQFDGVRQQFEHLLGTQVWWHSLWTAGRFTEPKLRGIDDLRPAFDAAHAALAAYMAELTDEGWERVEAWWKQWGHDERLAMGEALFQLVEHGVQHRAEIAVILTEHGCSPGDLDYLNFRQVGG